LLLATTTVMMHLAKLLHLLGSEYSGELRLHALVDGAELLAALILRQGGIGTQSGDLLLAISENWLELRGLVGRETETLANSLRSEMRVGRVIVPMVTLLRRCVGGRWGRLSQRQSASQSQGERG
jgi:hypothetical protein